MRVKAFTIQAFRSLAITTHLASLTIDHCNSYLSKPFTIFNSVLDFKRFHSAGLLSFSNMTPWDDGTTNQN